MSIYKRRNSAFTLAELLIMLGVMSILVLVALPVLNSKKTNAIAIELRKAYSTLEYIVQYLISESGYYSTESGFADVTPVSSEGSSNKFCYWFSKSLNSRNDYGCPDKDDNGSVKKIAQSTDNIIWYYNPAEFQVSASNYDNKIIVDVNGGKKPNCMSSSDCSTYKPSGYSCGCSSPDTFIIGVRYDGKLNIVNDSVAKKFFENQKKF